MRSLQKIATKKSVDLIKRDSFFFQRCVKEFFFLIDDHDFDRIEAEYVGRASVISFTRRKGKEIRLIIELEISTLPYVDIYVDSKIRKSFSEYDHIENYPAYDELQRVVQNGALSEKEHAKRFLTIWKKRNREINSEAIECLELLAKRVRKFLSKEHIAK